MRGPDKRRWELAHVVAVNLSKTVPELGIIAISTEDSRLTLLKKRKNIFTVTRLSKGNNKSQHGTQKETT